MQRIPLAGRLVLDTSGVCASLATVIGYLPAFVGGLASIAALIWYSIQIYYFIKDRKAS